jgi:hypothetical protein
MNVEKFLAWLESGDIGVSDLTKCSCLYLSPTVEASPEWKALVENWDRLEEMYRNKKTWIVHGNGKNN